MRSILALILSIYLCGAMASAPQNFADASTQARYQNLLKLFRCVTCQNQTLSESNAPVAEAMRDEIVIQLKAGRTDDEIKDFLVARYGDFVLFRPPFKKHTLILWLAPLLIGGAALGAMIWTIVIKKEKLNVE